MSANVNLSLRQLGRKVLVVLQDEPVGIIDWKAAKEAAIELKVAALACKEHRVSFVLMVQDGRPLAMDLDVPTAMRISSALHAAGAKAEEMAVTDRLTDHQAIAVRMGLPFAMTDDRRIQDQAFTDAQWVSKYRRMPMLGVPSGAAPGTPTIDVLPKKEGLQ